MTNEPQLEPNHSWDLDPPTPVYRVLENGEVIAIFFDWDDCLGFLASPIVKADKRNLTFEWNVDEVRKALNKPVGG